MSDGEVEGIGGTETGEVKNKVCWKNVLFSL